MSDKFRNKYRIPPARKPNWDYGRNAAYFITICTQNKEHFFGEIISGIDNGCHSRINEIGQIATDRWYEIPDHFPFVTLGAFVVMPNHIHGILIIDKNDGESADNQSTDNGFVGQSRDDQSAESVQTLHAESVETLHAESVQTLHATSLPPKNEQMAAISPKPGSISTIIRSYKSAVTKQARNIHADFAWQTRFHDHIIRNNDSFQRIENYIINNPKKWADDTFNDYR